MAIWAYVVMVAIDKDGKPIPVPSLELVSDEERAEWESAVKRYNLRRQRSAEGF